LLPGQIVTEILKAMGSGLEPEEERRLAPRLGSQRRAYDSFLRGRLSLQPIFSRRLCEGPRVLRRGRHNGTHFCPGICGNGVVLHNVGNRVWRPAAREVLAKADAAARRAIDLDEMVGEAHAALAVASTYHVGTGSSWKECEPSD